MRDAADVLATVARLEQENAALRSEVARAAAARRRVDTVRTRPRPRPRAFSLAFLGVGLVLGGAVGVWFHDGTESAADARAGAASTSGVGAGRAAR